MTVTSQIKRVQQTICLQRTHNLDARDQQPYGLLNTCLKRCDALRLRFWNLPSRLNRCAGSFSSLNRETASCHSGCRNLGGSPAGDAAANGARGRKTSHREKENVSHSNVALVNLPLFSQKKRVRRGQSTRGQSTVTEHSNVMVDPMQGCGTGQHSDDCGFLSPFAFFESPRQGGWGFLSFPSLFCFSLPTPSPCWSLSCSSKEPLFS